MGANPFKVGHTAQLAVESTDFRMKPNSAELLLGTLGPQLWRDRVHSGTAQEGVSLPAART